VFVEVKYRPDGHSGDGIEAVTEDKLRRLRLCADTYLGPTPDKNARIDILEITPDGIRHVENIY
ncbi:MAG: YraN family protein, partial [Clostridia bacterium]|nr:YraN family protein [Clostridia bacterium]